MDYIGIDGCRGGWLFSVINEKNEISIQLFTKLSEGLELLNKADRILIDMPIGLVQKKDKVREIDRQIRAELSGPFRSSVFTIPCKQAVYAGSYQEASRINKDVLGKGISIQAWNICSKIKELDMFLAHHPELQYKMKETHPELTFQKIAGHQLNHKKKTKEGEEERLDILEIRNNQIRKIYHHFRKEFLKKHVANDDLLDSLVLALF